MQETWEMWVWSLGWEDPLEMEIVTHSNILAREMPWTEEPAGLQSMESQSRTWLKQLSMHAILLGKCPASYKNALPVKTGWCPVHREKKWRNSCLPTVEKANSCVFKSVAGFSKVTLHLCKINRVFIIKPVQHLIKCFLSLEAEVEAPEAGVVLPSSERGQHYACKIILITA